MKQQLKVWVMDEMERTRCTEGMAYRRAKDARIIRKPMDGRSFEIIADNRPANIRTAKADPIPPGAIQMKVWRSSEATRLGLSESAIAMRINRGVLKVKTCRVNARVVYVIP